MTPKASERVPAYRRDRYFDRLPPAIEHATIADAIQRPLLVFPADSPLRSLARSMAANHVHSVVVRGAPDGFDGWGLVTDASLVEALGRRRLHLTAGDVARAPAVTAGLDQPLLHAAELMRQAHATHLLVLDPASRVPIGIVSALDLAATWAWGLG